MQRWGMLLAVVAAAGLTSCSHGASAVERPGTIPDTRLTAAVVGREPAEVLVPAHPARGRPLVLFLHGVNGNESELRWPSRAPFTRELVRRGAFVASSRAGGASWGNPLAVRSYERLAHWTRRRFRTGPTALVAESMGALPGLELVARRRIPHLVGLAGISPVTDLAAIARSPVYRDSVARAGPMVDPARLAPRKFAGARLRLYLATRDDFVPSAQQGEALAERLRRVAAVSVRTCAGEHAAPACWQPRDVLRWAFSSR